MAKQKHGSSPKAAAVFFIVGLLTPAPARMRPLAVGLMLRYNPGRMEDSVAYQISKGKLEPGTDPIMAVAVTNCAFIGYTVWLEMPDGRLTGPHTVADCSAEADLERHLAKGLAVEVSYRYAVDNSIPIHGGRFWLPLDGPLPGVIVWPSRPRDPWYCFLGIPCK